MINNIQQIASLLEFHSEDEFYFCQIIQRKKEHPELGSNNLVKASYYIGSMEQLLSLEGEIKGLCAMYNARAYINLNRCSYEHIAFHTLKNITDHLLNREYKSVKRSYNTACGQFNIEKQKKWIVDIDGSEEYDIHELNRDIQDFIDTLEPEGCKLITSVPTKNGIHLITKPFHMQKFKEKFPNIDVHKNNPTLLYCS